MTKRLKFGLVGHNIEYSRSPDIFQAIFDMTGTAGEFRLCDLSPAQFDSGFVELTHSGIDALSVTIPYKLHVTGFMDHLDETAVAIGAVNSIRILDGIMTGYNTDCFGFASALRLFADRLQRAKALVLGSGGAARAVVYSLVKEFNVRSITVLGRNADRLDEFQRVMSASMENTILSAKQFSEMPLPDLSDYELIVNCTPIVGENTKDIGLLSQALSWPEGKIYYDLNYGDRIPSIVRAREASLTAIDGRKMLVMQALRSFELWTGQVVPFDAIYEAVFGER